MVQQTKQSTARGGRILLHPNVVRSHVERILIHAGRELGDLGKFDLWGMDLRGADLTDADISHARFVQARANRATRWPEGFDPQAAGVQLLT